MTRSNMLYGSHKVIVEIYPECKYTYKGEESIEVRYDNVISFDVVDGADAKEIEACTDGSCIDDYHEYLVLHFEDGETSTFRNSYVDLFHV